MPRETIRDFFDFGDENPPPLRSLREELGLPEPENVPGGPTVSEDLLLSLIRKQLSRELAVVLYSLIEKYIAWRKAHIRLLLEEAGRSVANQTESN